VQVVCGHGAGHGSQQAEPPKAATTGAGALPQLAQQTWKTLFHPARAGAPPTASQASANPQAIGYKGLMVLLLV
jgi:hypothetical protein